NFFLHSVDPKAKIFDFNLPIGLILVIFSMDTIFLNCDPLDTNSYAPKSECNPHGGIHEASAYFRKYCNL
ncbi:MAG: hypothetical protein Q6356_009635, partial [Candidatus Wukongarchaeota archaeon]|nr:hypothetical protein [Candidatus Wukongarchaeota archaeon]